MDKKIKLYRRLPSKPPGPKFQCCTKLYIVSSALGFDFCPPAPNAQPKGNIEIWGCRGDDNPAGVSRFHFIVHLRYVMQYCNTLQWYATMNMFRIFIAACCSVLQRVAACCSVLQCVAVCSVSAMVQPPHHRRDPVQHGHRQCGRPKWLPQRQSPPGTACETLTNCFAKRWTRIQRGKRPEERVARGVSVSAERKSESSHPQLHVTLISMYSEDSCWVMPSHAESFWVMLCWVMPSHAESFWAMLVEVL